MIYFVGASKRSIRKVPRPPALRRAFWTSVLVLLASTSSGLYATTCADSLVHVTGVISGEIGPNVSLSLEISPDARRPAPQVPITDRKFELQASFDNFLFEDKDRRAVCGRKIDSVTLVVRRDGQEIKRVQLSVKHDFKFNSLTLDLTLRKPLLIIIECKSKAHVSH